MADTIAYKTIALHSKRGDPNADAFRVALANVPYSDLSYDDPTENNTAVATWFTNDIGVAPNFGDGPILTYSQVLWVDPANPDHAYAKTKYCLRPEDLPLDFLIKAV